MQYPTCRHIRTNGLLCKSPALKAQDFCYFHERLHQRHRYHCYQGRGRDLLISGQEVELMALEDRESIQLALSIVVNELATNNLDLKRARVILYGLQLASTNARNLQLTPDPDDVVRKVQVSPEGIDLGRPGLTEKTYDVRGREEVDDDHDESCFAGQRPTVS